MDRCKTKSSTKSNNIPKNNIDDLLNSKDTREKDGDVCCNRGEISELLCNYPRDDSDSNAVTGSKNLKREFELC